ncbi:hypothetical protein HDU79_002668 [Rhizoclosmatium sp. JEL0117]|nr:hypothetical protein HDU79_002668 [Rhizoclosmatium sp. JEL0117]
MQTTTILLTLAAAASAATTINVTIDVKGVPGVDIDGSCATSSDCKTGLKCSENKCQWFVSDVGKDCATYMPGYPAICKSGLICAIPNLAPAPAYVNTLGGSCAVPPATLPTVVKDSSAYGNTKDFDGCVKDTTKACSLFGWSADSVAYLCKTDEKKWGSQDPTPLYVCHIDGSAATDTPVATTKAAAPATGIYSGASSTVASGLAAVAFAFLF